MPTIGSITVGIHNHYDHTRFPELPYPQAASATTTRTGRNDASPMEQTESLRASVYIPTMPSTRFFVRYAVQTPFEAGAYLYFKLFIDGHHITSWGINPRVKARGHATKATFRAANDGSEDDMDVLATKPFEIRSFMFAPQCFGFLSEVNDGLIEVKVFRAREKRERVCAHTEVFESPDQSGIIFPGSCAIPFPKNAKYFDWVLIDSLDLPFATFNFYYCTWGNLESLSVVPSKQPHKLLSLSPSVGTLAMYIQRARQEYALDLVDDEHASTKIKIPMVAASLSESDIIKAAKTKLPGILKRTRFAKNLTSRGLSPSHMLNDSLPRDNEMGNDESARAENSELPIPVLDSELNTCDFEASNTDTIPTSSQNMEERPLPRPPRIEVQLIRESSLTSLTSARSGATGNSIAPSLQDWIDDTNDVHDSHQDAPVIEEAIEISMSEVLDGCGVSIVDSSPATSPLSSTFAVNVADNPRSASTTGTIQLHNTPVSVAYPHRQGINPPPEGIFLPCKTPQHTLRPPNASVGDFHRGRTEAPCAPTVQDATHDIAADKGPLGNHEFRSDFPNISSLTDQSTARGLDDSSGWF